MIAVDNASPDDSGAVLQRELPGARVLTFDHNRGFAAGANAAMARAPRALLGCYSTRTSRAPGRPRDARGLDGPSSAARPGQPRRSSARTGDGGPGTSVPSIGRTLLELTGPHRALPRRTRGRLLRGPYWTGGDESTPAGCRDRNDRPARRGAAGRRTQRGPVPVRRGPRVVRAPEAGGWRVGVCSSTTFVHDTSSSARARFAARQADRRRNDARGGSSTAGSAFSGGVHARSSLEAEAATHGAQARRVRAGEHRKSGGTLLARRRALKPGAEQA